MGGLLRHNPDAHPIIGPAGEGLYLACGFSGHGSVSAGRRGRRRGGAARGRTAFDLGPYRLERFAGRTQIFPETLVLEEGLAEWRLSRYSAVPALPGEDEHGDRGQRGQLRSTIGIRDERDLLISP